MRVDCVCLVCWFLLPNFTMFFCREAWASGLCGLVRLHPIVSKQTLLRQLISDPLSLRINHITSVNITSRRFRSDHDTSPHIFNTTNDLSVIYVLQNLLILLPCHKSISVCNIKKAPSISLRSIIISYALSLHCTSEVIF